MTLAQVMCAECVAACKRAGEPLARRVRARLTRDLSFAAAAERILSCLPTAERWNAALAEGADDDGRGSGGGGGGGGC
jgi:hypothetical protein